MLTLSRRNRNGIMALEWIIIATLLVIGLGFGLSAFRNVLIVEFGQTAESAVALRPQFTYPALAITDKDGNEYYSGSDGSGTWTTITTNGVKYKIISSGNSTVPTFSLTSANPGD